MTARYQIDRKRTYLFGFGENPVEKNEVPRTPLKTFLNFPEVFAGAMIPDLVTYRRVKAGTANAFYPPTLTSNPESLGRAKQRPLVLYSRGDEEQQKLFFAAYRADGFKFIENFPLTVDQIHFPYYTTD